jgi:thiosulfate/3-mercaptopyruvate sulfurtransferase
MVWPLVDAAWLAGHLSRVRPVDVRWALGQPGKGRAAYEAGHIPGAVFLDLDQDLCGPDPPGPGRHPLPDPGRFAEAMARAGVGDDTPVVAYDDCAGAHAARLWWLLLHFGHARAHVLDGGLAAWRAAGGALSTEVPSPKRARFAIRPALLRAVDREAVKAAVAKGGALLLDARARARYEGRTEPVDSRPGHIPGARSAPYAENLDPSGRMLAPDALRRRYEALGAADAPEVICYCGSGVTACHDVLALVAAGLPPPALYVGSWSDWSRDPALPARLGPDP